MLQRRALTVLAVVAFVGILAAIVVDRLANAPEYVDFRWGVSSVERADQPAIDELTAVETKLGQRLRSVRVFARWEDEFPTLEHRWIKGGDRTMVLSIKPLREDGTAIPWASLADAPQGSPLQLEMARWASSLRDYDDSLWVIFHHEPEAKPNMAYGTADDYKRAWRRFRQEVRRAGGDHVRFLWTVTSDAFHEPSSSRQAAERWYPGDDTVDAIGVDVYNWHNCRGNSGRWVSFAELIEPARRFGLAHPDKPMWIPEFGTVEDAAQPGRKAQWLNDVTSLLSSDGWQQFEGAIYFDHVDGTHAACVWQLDSSPGALRAFAAMGYARLGKTQPPDDAS